MCHQSYIASVGNVAKADCWLTCWFISCESHFNVSVGRDRQSHKTVSTNHNLFEEKGEPKWYWTEVLPPTSLTPYRLTGGMAILVSGNLWEAGLPAFSPAGEPSVTLLVHSRDRCTYSRDRCMYSRDRCTYSRDRHMYSKDRCTILGYCSRIGHSQNNKQPVWYHCLETKLVASNQKDISNHC